MIDHDFVPYISVFETIRTIDYENIDQTFFTGDIESPLYSSPELNNGKNISYKSDIYQFGLIIFFLFEKYDMKSKLTDIERKEYKCLPMTKGPTSIQNLYQQCVKYDQNNRPTLCEIISVLIREFSSFSHLENILLKEKKQINISSIIQFIFENVILLPYNPLELAHFLNSSLFFQH